MKKIIIVSRCLRVWWDERDERYWGRFSFRGFYAGEEITELLLAAPRGSSWCPDDYLMYVVVRSCRRGLLTGEVLRAKRLDELTCRD